MEAGQEIKGAKEGEAESTPQLLPAGALQAPRPQDLSPRAAFSIQLVSHGFGVLPSLMFRARGGGSTCCCWLVFLSLSPALEMITLSNGSQISVLSVLSLAFLERDREV